jgi:AraC-like DNA-binding protein
MVSGAPVQQEYAGEKQLPMLEMGHGMCEMGKALPIGTVYRGLGDRDRIGAGVMDKAGVAVDQREVCASTWSLVLVVRGRGRYIAADGRAWDLAAGDCFMRLPGVPQSTFLDPQSGWLEVFVDLGPNLWNALAATGVLRPEPPAWRWSADPALPQRIADLATAIARSTDRDLPRRYLEVVAVAVEAQAAATPAPAADDPIDAACRWLTEDAAVRLDLRSWCSSRGLDYERFRKDFAARLGVPPHQYRIRRRLDRACALLRGGASVAATAAELGYPSPYEFSAQFRRHLGVPPSRWR